MPIKPENKSRYPKNWEGDKKKDIEAGCQPMRVLRC